MKNSTIPFNLPLFVLLTLFTALFYFQASAQTPVLQLTPSNFNGYNISCFGSTTGSINLTITGGTPPYIIEWSNASTTEDLSNLPAGYYRVSIDDADTLTDIVEAEITLTQPEPLEIGEVQPYLYPNGYNVSQFGACNGNIQVNVTGGVTPYSYAWSPGQQTNANPTNLCSRQNTVVITDANGCETNASANISEPERDDWSMTGNYNTNPSTQFIGTKDSIRFTIKTNDQDRLSIAANGQLRISNLAGIGSRTLMADSIGKLIAVPAFSWMTNGNSLSGNEFIGSTNNFDLVFRTDGFERMRIKSNGKITIKEFESTANGLLYTDYLGEMWKLDFDPMHPDLFLDATGSFSALPTGSNAWSLSGQTVYNMHSGNTGIGTTSPAYKLHVVHDPGTSSSGGIIVESSNGSNANSEIKFVHSGTPKWSIGSNVQHNNTSRNFFIYDNEANANIGETRFYIDAEGRIGIGVIPPTSWSSGSAEYRLYV